MLKRKKILVGKKQDILQYLTYKYWNSAQQNARQQLILQTGMFCLSGLAQQMDQQKRNPGMLFVLTSKEVPMPVGKERDTYIPEVQMTIESDYIHVKHDQKKLEIHDIWVGEQNQIREKFGKANYKDGCLFIPTFPYDSKIQEGLYVYPAIRMETNANTGKFQTIQQTWNTSVYLDGEFRTAHIRKQIPQIKFNGEMIYIHIRDMQKRQNEIRKWINQEFLKRNNLK